MAVAAAATADTPAKKSQFMRLLYRSLGPSDPGNPRARLEATTICSATGTKSQHFTVAMQTVVTSSRARRVAIERHVAASERACRGVRGVKLLG